MTDDPAPQSNALFTYGLGLVFGLPVANLIAAPLTRDVDGGASMAIILGLTIVLGAVGASIGYLIDRARPEKGNRDGNG